MSAKYLALIGDTVQGICPLNHNGTYNVNFTGTWVSTPYRGVNVGPTGDNIILVGDTGDASCGHTFRAMLGAVGTRMPGDTSIHITDYADGGLKTVSIVENDPNVGVGISVTSARYPCTSN